MTAAANLCAFTCAIAPAATEPVLKRSDERREAGQQRAARGAVVAC
jgi:hypothetical protein